MRTLVLPSAALCAALGLVAGGEPAWARSPVSIEGPDEATRKAILDLLPDRDRPSSLFDAERIAEEAAARASAWLRSEGYYDAVVAPRASESPISARLEITLGQRYRFNAPQLSFDGDAPNGEAHNAVEEALRSVRAEAPARSADVLAAEAAALAALQHAGYADAAVGERRVIVDHATQRVSVDYHFTADSLVRLGGVRAEPDNVFRPGFIRSLRNWREGEVYTPENLARLRRDLTATGAVSRASTRLASPDADGRRDVVLDVEPAKRNAYELGFGYSTTEGAGVDAQWTRRNFTGRADSLTLSTTLGEKLSNAGLTWTRPDAVGLGHALSLGVSGAHEDTEAFRRNGVALFASVDAAPHIEFGRSFGLRLAVDTYDNLPSATVLSGFVDFRLDHTNFSLDPRTGSIFEIRVEPTASVDGGTTAFMRATGEARGYYSFGADQRLTLAGRIRAGWLEPLIGDADNAPADRRFYAGGGGSVRGYPYNSIFPLERNTLGLTPGGQGLLEGSIEARWRFDGRLGAAAFVDGGNAFDVWNNAADLHWGVGVGLRYDLGFAPLRVDIAFPLDHEFTAADYALYISVGQAF
ncbi:MAG: BamA/TamA family outer membrane protein [Proteobacteria bacterium]|nr:BamA/TamA family outer membrane protein [Pseudomonadota bacterium]